MPEQMAVEHDEAARLDQLAQLEAFGRDFLSSFATEEVTEELASQRTKASRKEQKKRKRQQEADNDAPREATPPGEVDAVFGASTSETPSAQSKKSKQPAVQTVVFQGGERPDKAAKKGWKAFMSSKIDNISKEDQGSKDGGEADAGDEEEKELKANDRLLSDLLSTTLFAPGSGNSTKGKLSSNDTIARIMELSSTETQRKGQALGRGWGENEVKRQQLSKAPAAIRQGMRKAAGERRDKEREKAKELGTWHPSLKQAYSGQATATERGTKKETGKRQRGMGVGIGKFQGGILTLSKQDISKVNGRPKQASKRGKAKK